MVVFELAPGWLRPPPCWASILAGVMRKAIAARDRAIAGSELRRANATRESTAWAEAPGRGRPLWKTCWKSMGRKNIGRKSTGQISKQYSTIGTGPLGPAGNKKFDACGSELVT